jgi:riboflavin biosynthesis pyrimidine reductase
MLMDLEGSIAGPDGRSGSLSGPADRRVFNAIRSHADAVIIGASTMRAERYRPMVPKPELVESRAAAGLQPALQLVIVSVSLDLPWDEAVFDESTFRPIVATCEAADPGLVEMARAHAEVLICPGDSVDPVWLLAQLTARGLRRFICEGGRNLLNAFAEAGLVDEWNLTLGPSAAGVGFDLVSTNDDEGFHFLRYVKKDNT